MAYTRNGKDKAMDKNLHPELANIINRHKAFHAGERGCLIKISLPDEKGLPGLVREPPFEGLDWDTQFEDYYKSRIHNGVIKARSRLDKGLGDDYITTYRTNFGMGVHYAMFGGKIIFIGGTSWMEPVITKAGEYPNLKYNFDNIWRKRMADEMDYGVEGSEGVLLTALWGGNGPMDMANGVMGNEVFTELMDSPDDMEKVMEICTGACDESYRIQKEHASCVMDGYIAGHANLWIPAPMFGHIGVDASCLTGPALYDEFEKRHLENLADKHGGFMVHTHMMGWRMIGAVAGTKGTKVLFPANDPNEDKIIDRLEEVLTAIGDKKLVVQVNGNELEKALKITAGRSGIVFMFGARDRDDALRKMDTISKHYTL